MSSKIDSTVVRKMLSLAKLGNSYSEQELQELTNQLASVLDYVQELQEVDTSSVSATAIIQKCKIQDLREDKEIEDKAEYERVRQNIINNFPKKQANLLLLPVKVIQ
jgi:aspartyl/glutamyl-tRNA(Asn/Gln) amidotransferase C subunit